MEDDNRFDEQKPDDRKAGGTNEGAAKNLHQEPEGENTSDEASTGSSIFENLDALRKRQDFDKLVGARRANKEQSQAQAKTTAVDHTKPAPVRFSMSKLTNSRPPKAAATVS